MSLDNKPLKNITEFIDDDKNTKLHYEAASGHLDEVVKEIDRGCCVDPVNYLGWTPLMMATRNGHILVVEHLIRKRANSTSENNFGCNLLLMAVASGNLNVLRAILQHLLSGGVSRRSLQNFFSPISLAVLFNYPHIVEHLIQNGFCINAISATTDSTPLMFANALRNIPLSQLLISKGARPINTTEYQSNSAEVSPVVLITPAQISPLPLPNQVMEMPRRCSDLNSPYSAPSISPFTPTPFVHQIFFPPNFSPNHILASIGGVPYIGGSHEMLNVPIYQPSPYCSPLTPVFMSPFNIA